MADLDQRGGVYHHPGVGLLIDDFEDPIAELFFGPVVYLQRLHAQAWNVGVGEAPLLGPLLSHRSVMILSWSFRRPSVSASGRGGHPGTYTSTGRILSTPSQTE